MSERIIMFYALRHLIQEAGENEAPNKWVFDNQHGAFIYRKFDDLELVSTPTGAWILYEGDKIRPCVYYDLINEIALVDKIDLYA